jgi:hypothetical protein
MYDRCEAILVENTIDGLGICDVDALKAVIRRRLDITQIGQIAGIRQSVDVHIYSVRIAWNDVEQVIGANESRAAGDEYGLRPVLYLLG